MPDLNRKIELIINRCKCEEEAFLIDTKKAASEIVKLFAAKAIVDASLTQIPVFTLPFPEEKPLPFLELE
jgi:hypothetical protein